jgi:hypothetical protein
MEETWLIYFSMTGGDLIKNFLVSLAGILNRLSSALILIATMGGFSTAWANNFDPWTTVGSAGTVDEADTSIVSLNDRFASTAVVSKRTVFEIRDGLSELVDLQGVPLVPQAR